MKVMYLGGGHFYIHTQNIFSISRMPSVTPLYVIPIQTYKSNIYLMEAKKKKKTAVDMTKPLRFYNKWRRWPHN